MAIQNIIKDNLVLLILQSAGRAGLDHHMWFYIALVVEPRSLYILDKFPTNQPTSPALDVRLAW